MTPARAARPWRWLIRAWAPSRVVPSGDFSTPSAGVCCVVGSIDGGIGFVSGFQAVLPGPPIQPEFRLFEVAANAGLPYSPVWWFGVREPQVSVSPRAQRRGAASIALSSVSGLV